jgi:hypothetical protein
VKVWNAASAPVHRGDEHFGEVAERNDGDHRADDELDRPEAETLEHEQAVGDNRGHYHAGEEREVEQQGKPDGAAQELRQIGRHGGDLADHPHRPDHRLRKMIAAQFREIAAGHDAELGRERLEQHRDQVGEQDDPKQAVAVFRAGLDVGREISRIHVGDRGDDRRAGEGQIGAQSSALPGQHLPRRRDRLVG